MFKHILLPTDGSELSRKAVLKGIEFAKSVGAKVSGFYVLPEYTPMLATEGFGYIDPETVELFEKNAEAYARTCLDAVSQAAAAAGVECECATVKGLNVHEAIISAAEEKGCDLIWMASHGRRGISGLLLGSETAKVLTHCSIPVLVFR